MKILWPWSWVWYLCQSEKWRFSDLEAECDICAGVRNEDSLTLKLSVISVLEWVMKILWPWSWVWYLCQSEWWRFSDLEAECDICAGVSDEDSLTLKLSVISVPEWVMRIHWPWSWVWYLCRSEWWRFSDLEAECDICAGVGDEDLGRNHGHPLAVHILNHTKKLVEN